MTLDEGTLTLNEGARAASVTPTSCLFVVLHADAPTTPPSRHALVGIDEVRIGRAATASVTRERIAGRGVLCVGVVDRWMSSSHARLMRERDKWILSDAGSKNGTLVGGARVEDARPLRDGLVFEVGRTFLSFREDVSLPTTAPPDVYADRLAGISPQVETLTEPLGAAFVALARVATSLLSVLVRGESGTGKEGVARAVHALSKRSGRFVGVNCGAIPESLVESELFGAKRGAFSGSAADRTGLVQAADGGTLFLDEIGDLPAPAQAALLRVLQEREVMPVGSTAPVAVDLRVVAATHRDLDAAVESGTFRQDLLARLRGFTLTLPPLRERIEDFGWIVRTLLGCVAPGREDVLSFEPTAARALLAHAWPTNIRELEQILTAASVVAGPAPIAVEHLQLPTVGDEPRDDDAGADARPFSAAEVARRDQLVKLLERHGGNVSAVAREMGKGRTQIQRWMKRYCLDGSAR